MNNALNQRLQPLVTIIIVTWNRKNEVVRCIQSALAQTYQNIEILVVDNASSDDTPDVIKDLFPQVRLIKLHRNLGPAEGRNIAFCNAAGDIFFCLDDDGWLEETAIEKVLPQFQSEPDLGLIQIKIIDGRPSPGERCYIHEFGGGASAIKRRVIEEVGGYPSDFFRQGEEADLAIRIINAGYKILFFPDALMYHQPSLFRQDKQAIERIREINSTRIAVKYYPLIFTIAYLLYRWPLYLIKSLLKGKLFVLRDLLLLMPTIWSAWLQRKPVSLSTFKYRWLLKKGWAELIKRSEKEKNL